MSPAATHTDHVDGDNRESRTTPGEPPIAAEPEQTEVTDERTAQLAHSIHLQRVRKANAAVREAQTALRNTVEDARKAGHTWEDVATAFNSTGHSDTADILGIGDIPSISDIVQAVLGTS